jgi:hypothetical protein
MVAQVQHPRRTGSDMVARTQVGCMLKTSARPVGHATQLGIGCAPYGILFLECICLGFNMFFKTVFYIKLMIFRLFFMILMY